MPLLVDRLLEPDRCSPRRSRISGDKAASRAAALPRGEGGGTVEEGLAAELDGDRGGFTDRGHGGLGVTVSDEPGGVVELAVGEMVWSGPSAQPADGIRVA